MVGKSRSGQCKRLLDRCLNIARLSGLFDEGPASKEGICALLMLESVVTLFNSVTMTSKELIDRAARQLLAMVQDPNVAPEDLRPVLEPLGLAHWVFSRDAIVAAGLCQVPSLRNDQLAVIFNNPLHPRTIGFSHYISGADSLLSYDATKDIEGHLEIVQVCGRSMDREVLINLLNAQSMTEVETFVRALWKKQDSLKAWFSLHYRFAKQDDAEPKIGPRKLQADRIRAEMLIQSKLVFICHRVMDEKINGMTTSIGPDSSALGLWSESKQRVAEQLGQLALFIRDLLEAAYDINSPRLLSLRTACVIQNLLPRGLRYLVDYLADDTLQQTLAIRVNNIRALVMGWKCCGWSWCDEYGDVAIVELILRRCEKTLAPPQPLSALLLSTAASQSHSTPPLSSRGDTQTSQATTSYASSNVWSAPSRKDSTSTFDDSWTPSGPPVPTGTHLVRRSTLNFDNRPAVSQEQRRSLTNPTNPSKVQDFFSPTFFSTALSVDSTDAVTMAPSNPTSLNPFTSQTQPSDPTNDIPWYPSTSTSRVIDQSTMPSSNQPNQYLPSDSGHFQTEPHSHSATFLSSNMGFNNAAYMQHTQSAEGWAEVGDQYLPQSTASWGFSNEPIYPQHYPFVPRPPDGTDNCSGNDTLQYLGDWRNNTSS
ncbi:hypothetical protein BT69DRAFT_114005 [Atractiella rhizophila]|nr:hypothetical protein BT69DRAFT_114005 [Atractiella rhizophila]